MNVENFLKNEFKMQIRSLEMYGRNIIREEINLFLCQCNCM